MDYRTKVTPKETQNAEREQQVDQAHREKERATRLVPRDESG